MEINNVVETLELDLENRLKDFNNQQLVKMLSALLQKLNKKELSNLLCDDKYFPLDSIINFLEKKEKKLLFQMLNEPGSEKELRLPIERWLKKEGFQVDIEVPYKIGKRKRVIDLVGWKKIGYLSRSVFSSWVDQEFIAIESKIRASRSAIDKAFSQASDYMKCAQ